MDILGLPLQEWCILWKSRSWVCSPFCQEPGHQCSRDHGDWQTGPACQDEAALVSHGTCIKMCMELRFILQPVAWYTSRGQGSPLWSPDPVFYSQRLSVWSLAGNLLWYRCSHLWWLCCAKQIVQQPASIWERKEDGPVVLGGLCGHREWVVREFVVACRVRLDEDGVRASPLLPVNDWSEPPWSVGLVVDGQ